MKSSTARIFAAFFVISFLVLPFYDAQAQSEKGRWKEIGKSQTDTSWQIDTESLSYPSGNTVSVWVRSIPDKGITEYREGEEGAWGIMKEIQARNFRSYAWTEGLTELDCSNGMFRVLYFVAYDDRGMIITSSLSPDVSWSFIIPGSVGETLRKAFCFRAE